MDRRCRLALLIAILFAAPATVALSAGALREYAGFGAPATLVETVFAALGVTNTSPLPVRQAWYFGLYILAPAIAAAVALAASVELRPRVRWPLPAVSACATLVAMFWVVHSLTDP